MYRVLVIVFGLALFVTCGKDVVLKDNIELQQLVNADQKDRATESEEPMAPKDDIRRKRVFELLAQNEVKTPNDKLNAALILQHTGFIFVGGKMRSKSVENYFLAYQLAKSALKEGAEKARRSVAVYYDRYSWMTFGFQKYGTQSTYVNDKLVWVTIDSTTTDEERAKYNVAPLRELLKQRPMQ